MCPVLRLPPRPPPPQIHPHHPIDDPPPPPPNTHDARTSRYPQIPPQTQEMGRSCCLLRPLVVVVLLLFLHLPCLVMSAAPPAPAAAAKGDGAPHPPQKRRWGESAPHQPAVLPDVDEENETAPGGAVVQLAQALIDIESVSGREQRMAKALEGWLTKRGWKVVLQAVPAAAGHEAEGERWNVYASRPEGPGAGTRRQGKGPRVLLNTHIDTVPPFYPASVDRKEGVIRGRGACDTKSILAAQLLAAQRLVKAGLGHDLGLLYVVSEETDHSGMKQANALGLKPQFLIVGEPTESKMIRSQKGILKLRLLSHGVSCHSGYPALGKSAIDPLLDTLHELKGAAWPQSEELGDTTLNIGLLKGGHAANALAAEAEATLMFRVISPPDQILKAVQEKVGGRVGVEVITANTPLRLGTVEGYPTDVASFNTDIAYFDLHEPGSKAFLIGPGSILDAHSDHELIRIEEVQRAVGYYTELISTLLATAEGSG